MNEIRNSPGGSPARRAAAAAAAAALLPSLLFGSAAFLTWFNARAAWLVVPSALGAPYGPPPLRAVPVGGGPWPLFLADLAAVAVVAVAAGALTARAVRRRPHAGRARTALSAWGAFTLGTALAGAVRGAAPAALMGLGPLGWGAYAAGGAVAGLLWGAALGWVCAGATAAVHRPEPLPAR
ncbi:hypothetical protein O4J56_18605 [Nocardiopsis sp. RSe5-2]|uniref:DUF2567 domain-containing protein n=1 Tax=Nocardiopsis endophytica TaxID=3018445 RepID=A0ABT4U6T6_9ACTN|nr:hypothetical protein [Nocardiopsis endophytica]MDA2812662.1 hypothetical protein [Nocardiopsis endophytica]